MQTELLEKCRKATCSRQASIWRQKQFLCVLCFRYSGMRYVAKAHGKYTPSFEELEKLGTSLIKNNMKCQDCGTTLHWLARDGRRRVVTLQHYRDGSLGFVCQSCNTRHSWMEDDTYRYRDDTKKKCPKCQEVKPITEFGRANNSSIRKVTPRCKACNRISNKAWHIKNRDRYNQRQARNKLLRKARQANAN